MILYLLLTMALVCSVNCTVAQFNEPTFNLDQLMKTGQYCAKDGDCAVKPQEETIFGTIKSMTETNSVGDQSQIKSKSNDDPVPFLEMQAEDFAKSTVDNLLEQLIQFSIEHQDQVEALIESYKRIIKTTL